MSERLRALGGDARPGGRGSRLPAEPIDLRYDRRALLADGTRGGLGLAATGMPSLFIQPLPVVEVVLLGCAAIFGVYLGRTVMRHRTAIRVDAGGVAESGFVNRRLAWAGLRSMKLRYYSTKRNREGGWLVLTLGGTREGTQKPTKIIVESTLYDFNALLGAAAEIAATHTIDMDETSVHNFAAAGFPIRPDDGAARREQPAADTGTGEPGNGEPGNRDPGPGA